MAKVYKNQTKLKITFDLLTAITGCSSVMINVRDPDGSIMAAWTGTIDSLASGTAYYDGFSTGSFPTKGTYHLQPTTTFSDGGGAPCETASLKIYDAYE